MDKSDALKKAREDYLKAIDEYIPSEDDDGNDVYADNVIHVEEHLDQIEIICGII